MRPLEGVRVLDLTRVLAGPFCTMLLSDLGAEVVKVERPGSGDDSRAFTPFVGGESAYFMSINRGKKSITVNLKHPKGKELILRLAKFCDVLVENFRPGVMEELGLGYSVLREVNPRLIYASISGFGQTGPYREKPAYDLIIQGISGMMSITGPDADHPTKVGSSIADIFAGVFGAIGILAALRAREVTGRGQWVDVAMLDSMLAVLENALARYFATGVPPRPMGNRHPSIAPFSSIKASDGYVNVACGNDELWRSFCEALGLKPLLEDPRFSTNSKRVEHMDELERAIQERTSSMKVEEILGKLEAAGVPCGPINDVSQVVRDAQVLAREMIVEVLHPKAGRVKVPGVPIKLSETPGEVKSPAPLLGEHTDEVLSSLLGLSSEEISALRREGAI